jgi:hypothetical protein
MSAVRGKLLFRSFWNFLFGRPLRLALALIIIIALAGFPRQVSTAQAGWQWYKTDTHIHSSVSADAYPDLGILSNNAKAAGYNAIFATDHNLASDFPANGVANQVPFEDSYLHLFTGTYGTLNSTANELVSIPVNTGSKSLHLASTSTGSAETYTWAVRGPNFRSGDIILKVSIYPTRIDAGSGVYVSASIGGDPRVTTSPAPPGPVGYTTQAGVISPGKSTMLVWQLGSARTASNDPNARVLTYSLGSYTLNAWNHYTINISNYLSDIPVADRPLDYNGLTYLKMAAASNNGTVDAYFDSYLVSASAPQAPAQEFIYRNSLVHNFDTSTFKIFPSLEMGVSRHANRFDFGITDVSQFVSYLDGVDGILATQQGGYPAQLNHPASPGGVTAQEAIDNQGYGADFMEVPRHQEWIDIWDTILNQGVQILGTGSTDKHTASYSSASDSTNIYAPALDFDLLIRSLFEGRAFMASGFTGNAIFNLDSASQEPYPARYPVYVPDTLGTVNVHLVIPSGASNGYKVYWIQNGVVIATDSVTGASYDAVKSISLAGATTYVRAELRSSSGAVRALTQPIFFRDIPNLPADKRYNVDGVITADGHGYTRIITKGITSSTWNAANQTLSLTLENATGSLVRALMHTNSGPQQILINSVVISPANSLNTFEAATGSIWYFDNAATLLYLKVKHTSGTANLVVNFSAVPATTITPTVTPTRTPTPTKTSTPTSTATPTKTPMGGHDLDTTGVFRPSNGLLYLKNSNSSGFADVSINYGLAGDYPVVGDWDGDGDATIGVYRNGNFLLRNSNTLGFADLVFAFGAPGDQPIAGDWNGDGIDTIGVYRPSTGQFLLRNSNTAGAPEKSFYLGNVGDVGIAGDWNGDGIDTTGIFRPSNGVIFLKNANSSGFAEIALNYGLAGDKPVTGDWNNDGMDTIGIYRNGTFYLRNSNTIGVADLVFSLGINGDMPIAGNWDGLP